MSTSNTSTGKEYISRINKVIDYIERNLDMQFTLDDLGSISSFSKYHFHRVFQSIVGETPFQFINRLRIEKAASILATNKEESISSIAFSLGFTDISIFSRNFKALFKVSPTQFRNQKHSISNLSQENSKSHQIDEESYMYFCQSTNKIKWRTNMKLNKSVEVKKLEKMTVAYIRHIGPYKGDSDLFEGLWNKLFKWAGPRGLIGGPNFKSICVYHDDPGITVEDKLRLSVCVTVPENTEVGGEIGMMNIEGGNYVVARFEVDPTQFQEAWEWVYGQWLPNSGYQPDDKPSFEVYPEEPKDGKFIVDICVPVKPL